MGQEFLDKAWQLRKKRNIIRRFKNEKKIDSVRKKEK